MSDEAPFKSGDMVRWDPTDPVVVRYNFDVDKVMVVASCIRSEEEGWIVKLQDGGVTSNTRDKLRLVKA